MHACMRACLHVCASVHTGLCACMCARAGVRACTCAGVGDAHMREECACVVSGPASSPPGNLQWGWLACTANTQTLVLLVLLLLNHWLLLNHDGFTSTRDTAVQYHENNR